MPSQYIAMVSFALLAASFPVVSLALLRRARQNFRETSAVLEVLPEVEAREISPEDAAREKKSASLPMAAMLFVIFDAAMVLLFPWAIKFRQMGWYGLIIAIVFLGTLSSGYAWLCKKSVLN